MRDSKGKFLPGHKGISPGRPKKSDEMALVQELNSRFPPEFIADKLEQALNLAIQQNSSRGIVAALTFIENYRTGLPVKRVIKEADGYDRLAALLAQAEAEGEAEREAEERANLEDLLGDDTE